MRILVVRIGAMGDVLHALPAVAALRQRHPGCFIGWAIAPQWNELLQIADDINDLSQIEGRHEPRALIDRWYKVDTNAWRRNLLSGATRSEISALRGVLQEEKFDLCVDLQGSLKSAVVGRWAGAKDYIGQEEPRERIARRLYGKRIAVTHPHVVEQACELLGAAIGEPLAPIRPRLPINEADELWADEAVGKRTFCLIAPGAGWGAKMWPAERYGAVAASLAKHGMEVLISAPPSGDSASVQTEAASGGRAAIVRSSLGQLIALTRRATIVIAGDTGPLHLAAALGRPVVGIYGPTSPARNGPWDTVQRVLRDESSVTSHKRIATPEPGMLNITAEQVSAAAWDLIMGG